MTALATRAALVVNVDMTTAEIDGRPITLPRKQFQLLAALAAEPSKCVFREDLFREVWGWHLEDAYLMTSTLRAHASLLRRSLGHGPRFVVNVHGRGYRLVKPGDENLVEFIGGAS